jgi:predicted ABC-type transport system involved in lysophospholipase L1 biosynthesis ATPase subunit
MSSVDNGHPVLLLDDLHKVYNPGSQLQVHVLKGVSLAVERGDYVAIMGHSGSGKSTMLNILGCLDVPTGGTYMIDGVDVWPTSATSTSASCSRASTWCGGRRPWPMSSCPSCTPVCPGPSGAAGQ